MLKKFFLAASTAALVALAVPSEVKAYGAAHVGYTHVGPNGAYHTGRTVASGPGGTYAGGRTTAHGAGGAAYRGGAAVGGARYGGGAAAGGYRYSGGAAVGGYGYVR
jgi:hypothetical protein